MIIFKFNSIGEISKEIIKNKNIKGTFTINSNNKENMYLSCEKDKLIITKKNDLFDIIKINGNSYYIICKEEKKLVGIDKNSENEILLYPCDVEKKNLNIWELINIRDQIYYIKNKIIEKYIAFDGKRILLKKLDKNSELNYEFRFLKLYLEIRKIDSHQLKLIENEPIDIIIKYIDLRDKNLRRDGIEQIYKDFDNEELKYSLRSIFEYIPWFRKIFIVMPNEKVRFLKSYEQIKDKIVYVNDKDFLGYDSANIQSFLFNLFKMKNFGISKNFIYMEDDCFIGKSLKKSDFFYYDNIEKKVFPYIINTKFSEIDKKKISKMQKKLFIRKKSIKPHSYDGFIFSIINTDKFFFEKYSIPIVRPEFTHCAIPLNLDDLKEIFNEVQDYKYINQTLFSKTRNIFNLNLQEFVNLYQLNIKHRKVHQINNSYIEMEKANLKKLNIELFVLNTGGNHKPSKKQNINLLNVMKKRFPKPTIYEITNANPP